MFPFLFSGYSNVGDEPHYFAFDGSLTTPPCSEGVKWHLKQETVQASKAQMEKFMSIFGRNARPVQPLNGRLVGEF
ncbi:MAG: carbonic anhydrase family protein [Chloroflexi bacterium]|nr:carbonic anhydrase family protein [Chloroflexota bacterium]